MLRFRVWWWLRVPLPSCFRVGLLRCKELLQIAEVRIESHSTCKRTKQRSDCGRPSTVGERKNNQMASRCLTLFTALHGPQLRSFANHTEQTKFWPLFGAPSAAIRWREDRETIIVLQIRTPTFGFVQLLVCRFATRPLEGHRSS